MEKDLELEGASNEPEAINEQKLVIAQLHTPSSFYHQFRKIIRRHEQNAGNAEGSGG